jgi:hypothetical protein
VRGDAVTGKQESRQRKNNQCCGQAGHEASSPLMPEERAGRSLQVSRQEA